MNIFIDTPQRAAERLENRRKQQKMDWRDGAWCGETRTGAAESAGPGARFIPGVPDLDLDEAPGYEAAGQPTSSRPDTERGPFAAHRVAVASEPQSIAADAYRDEKAYDRKRTRRRKRGHAFRILLLVLFMPIAIAAVFLISYVLTCILNGATPEEVMDSLGNLALRVESFLIRAGIL